MIIGTGASATSTDAVIARRAAVVEICSTAATAVIDRVVSEASRAANMFGLSRESASRYGDGVRETMPLTFEAMALPDGSERDALIARLAAAVRGVSEQHHIPSLVERGLVSIAVRIAREVVRRGAQERGFTPDELEKEFVVFADALEDRLFRA